MKNYFLLLSLIALTVLGAEPYARIFQNTTDVNAKCLDGSPPIVYLHQGSQPTKFLIFLIGGSFCQGTTVNATIEDCYQRTQTYLGSSNYWPEQYIGEGYLSTDPTISRFANWTKVLFAYCDATLFQGSSRREYFYKNTTLYFRGAEIVKSNFKWLDTNFDLSNADEVVFTGISAGAIGAFLWSNYLRSILKKPQKYRLIVDSGVFMNVPSAVVGIDLMELAFKNLYALSNTQVKSPIPSCNKFYKGQQYLCLIFSNSYTAVAGPILLVESNYDAYALVNILQESCVQVTVIGDTLLNCTSTELGQIQTYRSIYESFLGNFLVYPKNNVWSISCSNHAYAWNASFYNSNSQRVPENTGLTVKDAVEGFVFEGKRIESIDNVTWPKNKPCAY